MRIRHRNVGDAEVIEGWVGRHLGIHDAAHVGRQCLPDLRRSGNRGPSRGGRVGKFQKARFGAKAYTDEASVYNALDAFFDHESVNHSAGEYVRQQAHVNGMESFWSMMKRAHTGTFHKFSPKHLDRYVQEFAARHNLREADTIDIMGAVADGGVGKRLRYRELIADNGLASGARS